MTSPISQGQDPVQALLRASHHLRADQLGTAVSRLAPRLGARLAVVYLADYEQQSLVPLTGPEVPDRDAQDVDGSLAGAAFRRVESVPAPAGAAPTLWVPLLDGSQRLGVLELGFDDEHLRHDAEEVRAFAALVAELCVTRDAYSDVLTRLRRNRPMTIAAEIQWQLIPPLTFGTERIVIAGTLEPAYEIGGDTFDYAVNGPVADLMMLDAVGHGLPAALLSTVAVGAYRSGRRAELSLSDIAARIDRAIAAQFTASQFATGLLARLDLESGVLSWVNAGHPSPLVVRDGVLLAAHPCRSSLPFGLQTGPAHVCSLDLRPGDRVLLYTDGIVEARSPQGEFFGEERLADFVVRAEAAGDPPPETLRRLMRDVLDHQAGKLQDDASIVLVEWRSGREKQLQL
ncbi:PP2C family protein-serine/threonine phosphatase [Blastococcus atacamensis]|uniref:PP2C family protein-serine/threonine phosphatase n=1 Tax=Blastococcus atacamensis TaxID=2070508 RepID=UPI001E562672|nr:SpoIIE family protein phosphatase [Blastococcus atacamensis]